MESLRALQHVHCTPSTSMKSKKTTFNIGNVFLGILSSQFILQLSTLVVAILLLLAGDVERNPGPVTQLSMKDLPDVCKYLKVMDINKLRRLGAELGILYYELEKMMDLPDAMVVAWLREEDNVFNRTGRPSWESLVQALREIGQNGIASKIERENLGAKVDCSTRKRPRSSSLHDSKEATNKENLEEQTLNLAEKPQSEKKLDRIQTNPWTSAKQFHCLSIITVPIVVVILAVIIINLLNHVGNEVTDSRNQHKVISENSLLTPLASQTDQPQPDVELVQDNIDDETLIFIPNQSGARVVKLCIKKLYSSTFNMLSDNSFMERIAYVMSDFGRNVQGNGGIWQVSYTAFEDTMDTRAHKRLPKKYKQISDSFGIDWKAVKYVDLDKPFYSALAARLYLSNFAEHIPPASQLSKQAEYWKFYYMAGEGDKALFINKVNELAKVQEE